MLKRQFNALGKLPRLAVFLSVLLRTPIMKRLLTMVLLACGLLAACGGSGDDADAIDSYVGEWASCISSGIGYYTYAFYNFGKINESEALMTTRTENRYSDSACSFRTDTEVRSVSSNRLSLTGTITFMGKTGHQGSYGGDTIYLAAENRALYVAKGLAPSGWSQGYSKQ